MDVDSRSDEELLAEHLAGRAGAFEILASRYANELYGFLYRFVGDAARSEDLVQETFLQIHLAARSFDPTRKFKPWLYTIAANKARDQLRSRGRRVEHSLDATGDDDDRRSAGDSLEADVPEVADQVDSAETRQVVRALIARMPDHLRLILVLGYYQHMSYAEIADILEIPVGTVKSRLHAAVNHFARLWREHAGSVDSTASPKEEG